MRTKAKVVSLSALLASAVVFGMILAGSLDLTRWASAQKSAPAPMAPAASAALAAPAARTTPAVILPSFADIAEQVMPAIVSVTSTDIIKAGKRIAPYHRFNDGEGSPFDFFFPPDRRGAPNGEEEDRKELSGGTGFIIRPDGYILTNNHVIQGAEKVEVKVGDRDDYKARVVGRDPSTDLALLKIEGKTPFPTVRMGDSDRLRVGDWVMAIGDPLQFDKSVTVGVISGKGRQARLSAATSSFESLLQTDAAINFGNSGGPLVNLNGEVIGINTAISRYAQNIGFAVPINMAKHVLPQLEKGKVVRGYLGVNIESIDRKWQEAYDLKTAEGALVQNVVPGKAGDKAGLRAEDVIVRVDDLPVKTHRDLIEYVSSKAPGSKVALTVIRDGKEKSLVATLGTREEEGETVETGEETKPTKQSTLGLTLEDLTPAIRRTYGIDRETTKGVAVTHVKPVSPAADANLTEGDIILDVNGVEVGSVDDIQAQIKRVPKGKYIRFYVQRPNPRGTPVRFIAAVKTDE